MFQTCLTIWSSVPQLYRPEVNIARPREGLGGRSPPKNNTMFILALCAPRMGPEVNIARPREGLGGRSPPKNNTMFILALCAPRMGPVTWSCGAVEQLPSGNVRL